MVVMTRTNDGAQDTRTGSYVLGFDVGARSVGLTAVSVDQNGAPVGILASHVVRLDGGTMPGTEKSPVSRKAAAGQARRVRRLLRRRRQRLRALDAKLVTLGMPLDDGPMTYEPWWDRARLVEGYISDEQDRLAAVSRAVRHIARHRGWRNPWLPWEKFASAAVPTQNHVNNLTAAADRCDRQTEGWTVGQLGAAGTDPRITIRPRTAKTSRRVTDGESALFEHRILQEDQLDELRRIWAVQELPEEDLKDVERLVFHQNAPVVREESIGRDALPGMGKFPRAPRASLEFQRFRILAVVGNLRVLDSSGALRTLTAEEHRHAVDLLLHWHERDGHKSGDTPTWTDVAEAVGVPVRRLRGRDTSEFAATRPPVMVSLDRLAGQVEKLKPAAVKKEIKNWFAEAGEEQVASFVSWIADATEKADEALEQAGLTDVVASWDETALASFEALSLEAGRAAYSVESLRRLTARMEAEAIDMPTARQLEFGVDDSWRPPLPAISTPTGQPTVDQNLTVVRRALMSLVSQYGLPRRVNIEHVREAFMGPTALHELRVEQKRNQNRRLRDAENLREVLGRPAAAADLRRYELIQRQNGQCAYCGTTVTLFNAELDHIVPRARGGASTRANLLAVCRQCNHLKGKTPFAVWADLDVRIDETGTPLVTVEDALARTSNWLTGRSTARERNELREIRQRLRQRHEDEPVDERSMASTAYAAAVVTERVTAYLTSEAAAAGVTAPRVNVYRGSLVSAARKASGVDGIIKLRGHEVKHRGDFRHHALDAAVIAMMTPAVAQTLAVRESLRTAHRWAENEPEWKIFEGVEPQERESYQRWKRHMGQLAQHLVEAVRAGDVNVGIPLRLTRRAGVVHEGTVLPLVKRSAGGEWTATEIERVVSRDLYTALAEIKPSGKRTVQLAATVLDSLGMTADTEVSLYSRDAAQIPVRGGSAKLGAIHHARILAWRGKQGIEFGILRIFAGEINAMWPSSATDILTAPVPTWSMSWRKAAPGVLKALSRGVAVQVGWLAPGDELEIRDVTQLKEAAALRRLVTDVGESLWTVTGFEQNGIINISPRLLSSEGVTEEMTPAPIAAVVKKAARPSAESVLAVSRVIRRDALGRERVSTSTRLPSTFVPLEEANRLLEEAGP